MNALIQKRKVTRQKASRIFTFLENVDNNDITTSDIQIRLEKLEECWNEFNKVQEDIEQLCDDDKLDEEDDERVQFETKYYTIRSKALTILNDLHGASVPEQPPQENGAARTSPSADIKLPRLDLPTFGGNYQEWTSFNDLFVSIVHNNQALSPAQKLHYLKSSLRGEAAKLLYSIQVTDLNYAEAWNILTERYENKRRIVQSHLKSLLGQTALHTDSATGLRKLLDSTVEHVRALHVLGEPVDQWSSILVYLVSERLDHDSRRQWELSISATETPTFTELKSFLELRCRALEAAGCGSGPKPTANGPQRSFQVKQQSREIAASYHASTKQSCAFCNADHLVSQCQSFLGHSVMERTDFAGQHALCFNCLRSGHMANNCKSSLCRKCTGRHNTLLHFDKDNGVSSARNVVPQAQPAAPAVVNHLVSEPCSKAQILLSTAVVKVKDQFGQDHLCRVLLDSGSQSSFITEACVQRIGLRRSRAAMPIRGIGGSDAQIARGLVHLQLSSTVCDFQVDIEALVIPRITGLLPMSHFDSSGWNNLQSLRLADPHFNEPGPIDILLGADVFADLVLDGKISGGKNMPTAQNTFLGWILSGRIGPTLGAQPHLGCVSNHTLVDLDEQLKKFWELETVSQMTPLSPEEKQIEAHFANTHSRDDNGRYIVRLPFREDNLVLGDSMEAAVGRLKQLERSFKHSPGRKQHYLEFMSEYEELDHMTVVPPEEVLKPVDKVYYLPHHAVMKETSSTTKLRVVFDASAKTSSGCSLNDKLMVGPKVQDDLVNILLRFRFYKIAFSADVAKMYRQVRVHKDDVDFQRILWRDSPEKEIQQYRLSTLTYGTAPASYLAVKTLHQLATDELAPYPLAAEVIQRDFYVDDVMSGADDIDSALLLQSQLINSLSSGGFHLRKWSSNDPSVLDAVQPEDRETQLPLRIEASETVKTLGLHWHPAGDYFSFLVDIPGEVNNVTKRTILSEASRLFDPLGWVSPAIILAKIMFQRLWVLGLSWDETVPEKLALEWIQFRSQLACLQQINVQRCLNVGENAVFQIHGFCDASEAAYGAAIYIRSSSLGDEVSVHLLCSKTRVSPVKQVSLPRLELCAAVLLSRLICNVLRALNVPIQSVFAWTDSTVALHWIRGLPNRWKTFVANRVSEIQDLVDPKCWNHVPSAQNPADCASRGLPPNELVNHSLWWNGPSWLLLPSEYWPRNIPVEVKDVAQDEAKTVKTFHTIVETNFELLNRFSSLMKLQRVTAYCLRFIRNLRVHRDQRVLSFLTAKELGNALTFWVKAVQAVEFSEDLHNLKTKGSLSPSSRLLPLSVFVDQLGLLRVGGRLEQANIGFHQKHPIVLPKKHVLTNLIVSHEHFRHLHAGPQLLLAALQRHYWILGGRDVVRQHVHKCVSCFRQRASPVEPFMGNLPSHRVQSTRPFLRTGVDFGGPLYLLTKKGRGGRLFKAYIALFVCFSTKAIHLELVSDLTSSAFIASLKRFIARRGKCQDIYSDNATNFAGAKGELLQLARFLKSKNCQSDMAKFFAEDGINWHMIPPATPHFGGLWEAGIKSVKHHLRRVCGDAHLTYEEMYTMLTQVEACLNSRPLCPLSSDPNDLQALTPGHFLIGDALTSLPEIDYTSTPTSRLSRWKRAQQLQQHFWKRWHTEYLSLLQHRPKWALRGREIKVGDLVLVKGDNLPPQRWNLARIIQLHPGKDGISRVASVKTIHGIYKRPFVKLCPLPINEC